MSIESAQSCSLVGRDFLVALVGHVVREAAPQLTDGAKEGGGSGENLGMALDVCIHTCPLLPPAEDGGGLRRINDRCVDLLCLIGDKMCGRGGGEGNITSKTRSRLLGVVQKAFKGFKVRMKKVLSVKFYLSKYVGNMP